MQKYKVVRWPAYNPVGDVLRAKLVWATSWIPSIVNPATVVQTPVVGSAPYMINDIYEITNASVWAGTSHPRSSASLQASVIFRRFRCTGVKIQWQASIVGTTGAGNDDFVARRINNTPYMFCVHAGGSDNNTIGDLAINPFITPEQRWSICRDVDGIDQPKKWHSVYFSMAKLVGQEYTRTDTQYSGYTSSSDASGFSPAAAERPVTGAFYRFGITSPTGLSPQATYDPMFIVQFKYTFYVTYFDKIPNTTQ